jgi:hypothetical protein
MRAIPSQNEASPGSGRLSLCRHQVEPISKYAELWREQVPASSDDWNGTFTAISLMQYRTQSVRGSKSLTVKTYGESSPTRRRMSSPTDCETTQ